MYTKDDGETSTGIFNGDIGTIIEINKSNNTLKFDLMTKLLPMTMTQHRMLN